jgi:hypothetical protein
MVKLPNALKFRFHAGPEPTTNLTGRRHAPQVVRAFADDSRHATRAVFLFARSLRSLRFLEPEGAQPARQLQAGIGRGLREYAFLIFVHPNLD